jgi:hypothetical protein
MPIQNPTPILVEMPVYSNKIQAQMLKMFYLVIDE